MNIYRHPSYARAMLFSLFAGGMTVFFSNPASAQVGTTRGRLAKGDTQEKAMKPALVNQSSVSGKPPAGGGAVAVTTEKSKTTAPVIVAHSHPSQERLAAAKVAAGGNEHVVVVGDMYQTGATGDYLNKTADLGPLGTKKMIDTPFSVMEVPQDVLENQQVRNIDDSLKYLPSVQLEERGDPAISRPQSRGFEGDVEQNSRFDGLNALATTPYASEMFQKVTVLNGLAGAIYGPQDPAGTFDYTFKRPTENFFANFNMGADSGGAPLEHLDIGNRGFGGHARWFGYRINLLNQQGESYTQGSHMRRDLASGSFDIHLSKKTTIEANAFQYSTASRGLPGTFGFDGAKGQYLPEGGTASPGANGPDALGLLHSIPKAPDIHHAGYGQRAGGYNTSTSMGQLKLIHKFNDKWNFRTGVSYEDATRDIFLAANTFTLNQAHADTNGAYSTSIAAATTAEDFRTFSNFAYLTGEFNTGSIFGQKITHHVNIGSTGYWLGNYNPTSAEQVKLPGGSIGNPFVSDNIGQVRKSGRERSATTREQNAVFGDTIDIGKHLSIMGQVAWSWIREENYGIGTSTSKGCSVEGVSGANCTLSRMHLNGKNTLQKKDGAFSPQAAIIYKFNDHLSTYFTWGTSWAPGPLAAPGTYNVGVVAPPQKSTEYEGGVKYLWRNRILINVDAFSMERPYYYVNQQNVFTSGGTQRNIGLETQISGKVTKDLSVLAGFTYLDAVAKNKGNKYTNNNPIVGVAPLQANILLDYRVPVVKGLAFNANVHYIGARAADVYNVAHVDAYTTLDLGARYATKMYGHELVMRFNVNNVTNESYWGSVFPSSQDGAAGSAGSVVAGLPRTWSVTASTYF